VEAVLVEEDARELFGADMLLAEASGNPVFLHLIWEEPRLMPFKIMDLMARLQRHAGLFLRAYGDSGITVFDDPLFLFILGSCPDEVVSVVKKIDWARVKVFRADPVNVDGTSGTLIREIHNESPAALPKAVFFPEAT
jgi:hypothetical protein